MLKPKYLEELPEAMVALYSQVEQDILRDMARRVSAYDYWVPSVEHQRKALVEMGNLHDSVLEALSARAGKTRRELERLMEEAGEKSLSFDAGIYRDHGLDPPPLAASRRLRAILRDGLQQTNGVFKNLTGTTANTVSKQLEDALDRAWLQISTGAFGQDAAIRMAVKDLARQGVGAARYPSGHTDTLEVAVRRAVVTGVNQTCGRLQLALADEMGCDLMELTAHAGARPSHALWQGKIVSRGGRKGYLSLADIGYGSGDGFKGWNCSHDWNPYFEGMPRAWTETELKKLEEPAYSYNGQRLTEYEAAQRQRYIERQIRRWKREGSAMEAAGLDTSESAAKVRQWQDTQRDFLRQTGLKRQYDREQVHSTSHTVRGENGPRVVTRGAAGGRLEAKEFYAIDQYKKSSVSFPLNSALRGEAPLTEAQRAAAQAIDRALSKLPAYEGTVYRSLRSEDMVEATAFWRRYQPGAIVLEEAYTSASVELYDSTMDILMIIQSKRGRDMRVYNPLEQEVLFMRGSTFFVEKREGDTLWLTEI